MPEEKFVPGEAVIFRCAHGDKVLYPIAEMNINVDGLSITQLAAVSEKLPVPVLLRIDVGIEQSPRPTRSRCKKSKRRWLCTGGHYKGSTLTSTTKGNRVGKPSDTCPALMIQPVLHIYIYIYHRTDIQRW